MSGTKNAEVQTAAISRAFTHELAELYDREAASSLVHALASSECWLDDVRALRSPIAHIREQARKHGEGRSGRHVDLATKYLLEISRRWGGQSTAHRLVFAKLAALAAARNELAIAGAMAGAHVLVTVPGPLVAGDRKQTPDDRTYRRWRRGFEQIERRARCSEQPRAADWEPAKRMLEEVASVVAPTLRVATDSADPLVRELLGRHADRLPMGGRRAKLGSPVRDARRHATLVTNRSVQQN